MNPKRTFVKNLLLKISSSLVIQLLKWSWPFLVTILTFMAGWLQKVPWIYTITLTTFVFATMMTGILRFEELKFRRTLRDRLILRDVTFAFDYSYDDNGKPKNILAAQIILRLENISFFPISYTVDEINSSIESRINQNPKYDTRGATVPPQSFNLFRDAVIDMGQHGLKEILNGRVKLKLRYGKKGREKYPLAKDLNLFSNLDKSSGSYLQVWSQDAPDEIR